MRRFRFVGLRFVLFGILAVTVVGFVTSGLWNWLLPGLFGVPAISFWQAIGLFLLSRILFGRVGRGRFGRRTRNPRFARGWASLTPEERERFRRAMGPGCERFGEPEAPAQ